jgi:hypothetical protein
VLYTENQDADLYDADCHYAEGRGANKTALFPLFYIVFLSFVPLSNLAQTATSFHRKLSKRENIFFNL